MIPRLETVMLYGKSGIGKTSQLYHLIKYYHAKYPRRVFRLVSAELGNNIAPFEDSGMIDEGIVQVFDVSGVEKAFAVLKRIGEGWWPKDGARTISNTTDLEQTTPEEWSRIGGYLVESMVSLGRLWLNHISDQVDYVEFGNDKGWKGVGFKPAYVFTEEDAKIVGLQGGHYGIVQKNIHKLHQKFCNLPIAQDGLLAYTSLESRGDEDLEAKKMNDTTWVASYPIYGPAMVGQASTNMIPSWFRHTIHVDEVLLPKKTLVEGKEVLVPTATRVGWFRNHSDTEKGINYLCKPRILPELFPTLMEKYPGGFVQIGFKRGIDKYFQFLEEVRAEFQKGNKNEVT